jgi:signal transduction histidine kinase
LPPGEYRFQVIACNNDGVWNSVGTSLDLTQLPHFWQTWWFQGAAGLVVVGTIFGVVRSVATRRLQRKLEQLRHQRAIERERERIAQDIHDDLGAGLTQILLQSSLARRDTHGQVQTDFTQIADTARDLVRTMDEIVWAINPEHDSLEGLATYLGKFVTDFVGAAGKRCRILLPPQLPEHTVSAEARHNLYLAVKEALHNAIKHSAASEISFQLQLQPHAVVFSVKDNGHGFDQNRDARAARPRKPPAPSTPSPPHSALAPSRLSSGHGLRNIAQRLEAIGGHFNISSEPGQGTTVELTLPLSVHRKPSS